MAGPADADSVDLRATIGSMTSNSQRLPRPDLIRAVADDLEELLDPDGGWVDAVIGRDLDRIVATIRNYLEPRLANRNAPFNVVFVGPTGSGKSTIVNSLAGRTVSPAGSIRPTTNRPVVFSDEKDKGADYLGSVDADVATGKISFASHITLVDTPDIDSTNVANHGTALQVLAASDVVVFVASALRYADLVPWQLLRSVTERGIPVIHVLNRVSPQDSGAIIDFRRRLRAARMTPRIIHIAEHRLGDGGILPRAAVRSLKEAVERQTRDLDRVECLDRALASIRSDLSAIVHTVNADMLRVESVVNRIHPESLAFEGYEPTLKVAKWESDMEGTFFKRTFGRRRFRARLERIGAEVRFELVTLLERNLRLFAIERGGVVIDLTSGDDIGHLGRVDSVIETWYESLDSETPTVELSAAGLRSRVNSAISVFREVTVAGGEPSAEAIELRNATRDLYVALGDELAADTDHARILSAVQRARARIRPEPALASA
jgi:GTPase Era involved in 16S rRNA processing